VKKVRIAVYLSTLQHVTVCNDAKNEGRSVSLQLVAGYFGMRQHSKNGTVTALNSTIQHSTAREPTAADFSSETIAVDPDEVDWYARRGQEVPKKL
jgi:hypothetical protein